LVLLFNFALHAEVELFADRDFAGLDAAVVFRAVGSFLAADLARVARAALIGLGVAAAVVPARALRGREVVALMNVATDLMVVRIALTIVFGMADLAITVENGPGTGVRVLLGLVDRVFFFAVQVQRLHELAAVEREVQRVGESPRPGQSQYKRDDRADSQFHFSLSSKKFR
jgi:hypothetical protein